MLRAQMLCSTRVARGPVMSSTSFFFYSMYRLWTGTNTITPSLQLTFVDLGCLLWTIITDFLFSVLGQFHDLEAVEGRLLA